MPRTPLIPLPFPPLPLLVAVRRLSYSVEVDVARFIIHCMLCFQVHNIREVTLFALLSIPKNLCTLYFIVCKIQHNVFTSCLIEAGNLKLHRGWDSLAMKHLEI